MTAAGIKTGLALACLLGLAACSSGTDGPAGNLQLLQAIRGNIAARVAETGKPAPPKVDRALLDTLDGAYMEAVLEKGNLTAYMFVDAERADDGNGPVTVWRTYDEVTLALRNGVLVATRGIGGDLLSTEITSARTRPGPPDGGARVQHIRDSDDGTVPLVLACAAEDLGPETVEIVGQRHATRHLRERCEGHGGTVINDYWIDSAGGSGKGRVWQSRQWAGPHIGYLRLRQLTE